MIVKMEPDEFYTFRVQYLADMDPFNCLTMFPMPTRAPTYAFASSTPLATQLGAIVRLLGAPQRVYTIFLVVTFKVITKIGLADLEPESLIQNYIINDHFSLAYLGYIDKMVFKYEK